MCRTGAGHVDATQHRARTLRVHPGAQSGSSSMGHELRCSDYESRGRVTFRSCPEARLRDCAALRPCATYAGRGPAPRVRGELSSEPHRARRSTRCRCAAYWRSKTSVEVGAAPGSTEVLFTSVSVLPSLETVRVVVPTILPSRFWVAWVVWLSMRLALRVS